ncbi:MAG TPA: serine/threonine-protein kinase [Kofleriaceae bacterium]|nr:serine/threonine-protein kinase [Kofleriaceae bacterium]
MDPASLPRSLGAFRIEAVLGEGGSGVVYDATWGPRRVALKVMHETLAGTDRVRSQFLSESKRLQTITHPAVVKVLAVGELPDGRPYLAMERLEGETLAQVLGRGALPLGKALELFAELCSAVATLHEQGLVHRDLKPENVFIVGGASAVLLDFGIAKELAAPASTTTMDGGVRGTPAYMAPERFFGQPAGIATDIYELAVILYAMLAGRLPWDDLGDPEARLSPRPLVELVDVPAELDVELRRALSTRAQNRPTSAIALRDAVGAAAGGSAPTTAAETARMRPATGDVSAEVVRDVVRPTETADTKPWFAERQSTTDRGKTPLAWMPTQLAPQPTTPARRSLRARAPMIAGGLAVVGVAVGALAWRLAGDEKPAPPAAPAPAITASTVSAAAPAPTPATVANDPWAVPSGPTRKQAPPIPVAGPPMPVAKAQAELNKALAYLPADTTVILGATVSHVRSIEKFEQLFEKLRAAPQATLFADLVPPCVAEMMADADWAALGSPGFDAAFEGTLIIGGRFARRDVDHCFEVAGGHELHKFLDDHTVLVSVRDDVERDTIRTFAEKPQGLPAGTRAQIAKLPVDRAFTFVVDGTNNLAWPSGKIPDGSDAWGWVRSAKPGLALELAFDVKDAEQAELLEADLREPLNTLFTGATDASGKLVVTRTGSTVKISGTLSWLMVSMVVSSLK